MNKNKKSAKEKKALAGALVMAGVIAAGSTFAWFTSSDEVTNRLSANADYNVSAVESFDPPEDFVPGQTVNKDVYALNTGNVPAFVETEITSKITITKESASENVAFVTSGSVTIPTNGVKLNTKAETSTDSTGVKTATANEVAGIQAGAVIAYSPTATQIGNTVTAVDTNGDAASGDFTPTTKGLYVFRHNATVTENEGVITKTYTYKAYYYDNGTYYKVDIPTATQTALSNASKGADNVNGTLAKVDVPVEEGETKTAAEAKNTAIDNALGGIKFVEESTEVAVPTLTYEAAVTEGADQHPARLKAVSGGVIIYANLVSDNIDNAGSAVGKWQLLPTNVADNKAHFYYTNVLAAGAATSQLVDSVVMDKTVTQEAYKSFDFDLNVTVNSAQAVVNDAKELLPTAANETLDAKTTATSYSNTSTAVKWENK